MSRYHSRRAVLAGAALTASAIAATTTIAAAASNSKPANTLPPRDVLVAEHRRLERAALDAADTSDNAYYAARHLLPETSGYHLPPNVEGYRGPEDLLASDDPVERAVCERFNLVELRNLEGEAHQALMDFLDHVTYTEARTLEDVFVKLAVVRDCWRHHATVEDAAEEIADTDQLIAFGAALDAERLLGKARA